MARTNKEYLWVIEAKSPFIAGRLAFYPFSQAYHTRKEAREKMTTLNKGVLVEYRVRKYTREN